MVQQKSDEERLSELREIADSNPFQVDLDGVVKYLRSQNSENARQTGAYIVNKVAESNPSVAKQYVSELVEVLNTGADDSTSINQATTALSEIARKYPGEVQFALDEVADLIDCRNKKTRSNSLLIMSRTAGEYPGRVEKYLDEIIEQVDDPYDPVRKQAARTVEKISRHNPDLLIPTVET